MAFHSHLDITVRKNCLNMMYLDPVFSNHGGKLGLKLLYEPVYVNL